MLDVDQGTLIRVVVALIAAMGAIAAGATAALAGPLGSQRALAVKLEGSGLVRSDDGRIDCSPRCVTHYQTGRDVLLRARPLPDFAFRRWTGGCVGAAPICVVTMSRAVTVRALFARVPADVAVSIGGPGAIISETPGISCSATSATPYTCAATFGRGSVLLLLAAPSPGATLAFWGGACRGATGNVCEVRVGRHTEVSATFRSTVPAIGSQQLTVSEPSPRVTSTDTGIDCPGVCSASVESGAVVTLRSESSTAWGGACAGLLRSCTVVVDGPTVVASRFLPQASGDEYGLNVTLGGSGRGRVVVLRGGGFTCASRSGRCSGFFFRGTPITLVATPERRSVFKRWVGQRSCNRSRSKTCRLTILGRTDLTVVFGRARR